MKKLKNPKRTKADPQHVVRSGSYYVDMQSVRAASSFHEDSDYKDQSFGMRPALVRKKKHESKKSSSA